MVNWFELCEEGGDIWYNPKLEPGARVDKTAIEVEQCVKIKAPKEVEKKENRWIFK